MTSRDLQDRRLSYQAGELDDDVPPAPWPLFEAWLSDAVAYQDQHGGMEATAMTLSTCRMLRSGMWQPSARVVLLKGYDESGLVFFTNYESDKAQELAANPHVACSFFWPALERQIRIQGIAQRVDAETSDGYFAVRPRGSQIGAWASQQSRPVSSREALQRDYHQTAARFDGKDVPRPDFWGGYRVAPHTIEFWQGRESRFHDRISYTLAHGQWSHQRLSP